MGRTIVNLLATIVLLLGVALVIAWNKQVLSEANAIFYFSLALAILAIVHFVYAIYSGEIAAKGILVYRNRSPGAFYTLLILNFSIVSASIYAAYSFG